MAKSDNKDVYYLPLKSEREYAPVNYKNWAPRFTRPYSILRATDRHFYDMQELLQEAHNTFQLIENAPDISRMLTDQYLWAAIADKRVWFSRCNGKFAGIMVYEYETVWHQPMRKHRRVLTFAMRYVRAQYRCIGIGRSLLQPISNSYPPSFPPQRGRLEYLYYQRDKI